MVELFEEDGVRGARRYLDHLKMEYAFWMDGAESLILIRPIAMLCGCRTDRCSTVTGTIATHRVTNHGEDVETAKHSGRPPNEVYRDLRAGRPPVGITLPAGCVILVVWRAFVPPSSSPSI